MAPSETSSDRLSIEALVREGKQARNSREILHQCWDINCAIRDSLWEWVEERGLSKYPEDYAGVSRVTVTDREQSSRHDKHYVVIVDAEIVADSLAAEGYVVVDAALDQFNDRYAKQSKVPFSLGARETLAPVVVAPPGNEFRIDVYHPALTVEPDDDINPELPI